MGIETSRSMSNAQDVVLKEVDPLRVAELSGTAASYSRQDIDPILTSLYLELIRRLAGVGERQTRHPVVYYQDPADPGDSVIVHCAIPTADDALRSCDFAIVDLPGIRCAALTHRGPIDELFQSLLILAGWIEDNGYRAFGYHREVYLEYCPCIGDVSLIELQVPVGPADGWAARGSEG
jgi:effector-binding domain-containing protein